ncbi:MAG TPA: Pls/PosA family non-ribosomal peptide synthetase, partial [Candidatus Dormibacteraeota bacterium]
MAGDVAMTATGLPADRTTTPRWTEIDCLAQLFEHTCRTLPDAVAVECGAARLTYRELDERANRLAHLLRRRAAEPGLRVGILLERSLDLYVAVLGVLKAGAAYVPIDPSLPADRVAFIVEDAGIQEVLTSSAMRERTEVLTCSVLELDRANAALAVQPQTPPRRIPDPTSLCYVIYTSGTTGRPKGVAVSHASIVNFLRAAAPIYDVRGDDRVYQGMTLAFDFSFEEIWPAWMAGATLVAGPTDSRRLGHGLTEFLIHERISVMCCVPTLLATLDEDVPTLRTLLVGGEACPADLVRRWARPGRRMLNTYGPTEATVTATWCELQPGRRVTIGVPLPTYHVYILDERLHEVGDGETGEICIGGPGVAIGYVDRPDLTADRFVDNPIVDDVAWAPRLYRTGDLGRVTVGGEIEFLGRIDTQVKIRGYRIELGEIEEVIREDDAVENAVVSTLESEGAATELVGYVTLRRRAASAAHLRERLHDRLHRRLPTYMVPAFIEVLDVLPTTARAKVARRGLPAPVSPRLGLRPAAMVPPASGLEAAMLGIWTEVLGHTDVSVEADFFTDLGGHSLFAAMVVSRLRRLPEGRGVAIADLYERPTIRGLAGRLEAARALASARPEAGSATPAPLRHRDRRVLGAGVVQLTAIYGVLLVLGAPTGLLMAGSRGTVSVRLLVAAAMVLPPGLLLTALVLPVVGRWTLAPWIRPGRHPLWGVTYVCWWLNARLLGLAPLRLLAGSPLMAPYLRLLGARVGDGCHIATERIQTPSLTRIGDGASLGYGVDVMPATVEDGWLVLEPVRIGAGAVVGTGSVLLGGSEMGRGARLAEQSLLACGERVPDGRSWGGSPAAPSAERDALLDAMEAAGHRFDRWSRGLVAGFAAGVAVLGLLPFVMAAPGLALVVVAMARWGLGAALASTLLAGPVAVLSTCGLVAAGKRLALPHAQPGIHPLCSSLGLRKWFADRLMTISLELSNTLYNTLYAVAWLRLLGARVGRRAEVSTVAHIDPDLLTLGDESFVADLASVGAATFAAGAVALARTEVGRRSFVGNAAVVRSDTRLGDGSLIGVQSVSPGRTVEPDTAWLGSPAIFLPRRQPSDAFGEGLTYRPSRRLVAARLAIEYVRATLPATMLTLGVLVGALLELDIARSDASGLLLVGVTPAVALGMGAYAALAIAALKWLIVGRYRPRVEPLWALFVRRTELITGLYESVAVPALVGALAGTPWIGPVLRVFGARIGRRVCLQTTYLTEFDLVEVGDDACVGASASLQT